MTIKPFHKALAALVLCGSMASAHAASVMLVATTPTSDLAAGSVVTFEILADFTDTAAGTTGGGFDVLFDSSVLQFDSLFRDETIGEADFSRDPDILDGLLDDWTIASFNALGADSVLNLGNISFVVLDTLGGGSTTVAGTDARAQGADPSLAGFWVDASDFVSEIPVNYNGVELSGPMTVVPVPAAVWLMLSGVGALLGFGRKSA